MAFSPMGSCLGISFVRIFQIFFPFSGGEYFEFFHGYFVFEIVSVLKFLDENKALYKDI